jgi:hypothetical protein
LLVGKLLLAGLKADVVGGMDQTGPGRRGPVPIRARLGERIAHRGKLIGDGTRRGVVELGAREIVPGELDEPRRDGAARGRGIAGAGSASDAADACNAGDAGDERREHRVANHPRVFGSALARVKEVSALCECAIAIV